VVCTALGLRWFGWLPFGLVGLPVTGCCGCLVGFVVVCCCYLVLVLWLWFCGLVGSRLVYVVLVTTHWFLVCCFGCLVWFWIVTVRCWSLFDSDSTLLLRLFVVYLGLVVG